MVENVCDLGIIKEPTVKKYTADKLLVAKVIMVGCTASQVLRLNLAFLLLRLFSVTINSGLFMNTHTTKHSHNPDFSP